MVIRCSHGIQAGSALAYDSKRSEDATDLRHEIKSSPVLFVVSLSSQDVAFRFSFEVNQDSY